MKRTKYSKPIPVDNSKTTYDFKNVNNRLVVQKTKTSQWKKEDAIFRSKSLKVLNKETIETDFDKNILFEQCERDLNKAFHTHLTPREEKVLRMRFGIGLNTDYTLDEVGLQLSVTRERVRMIEAKALRKLKCHAGKLLQQYVQAA